MTIELLGVQDIVDPWWVAAEGMDLKPGRLVRTFVPFPDVLTHALVIEGREEATDHSSARFRVEPLRGKNPSRRRDLPVAALPSHPGEAYIAQRGKWRPALIISVGGPVVPREELKGGTSSQRRPCAFVAPYYGADQDGTRAGLPGEFLDRVRSAMYPQFVLDTLPIGGVDRSLLRLDHMLAIGADRQNFELLGYELSPEALAVTHEWVRWLVEEQVPAGGLLELVRQELLEISAVR